MSNQLPTPQEWGLEQALRAPAWSDQTWLTVLATLGLRTTHIDDAIRLVPFPVRRIPTSHINTDAPVRPISTLTR